MFINDNELHEVNLKFDKYGNSSIISYREDKGEYDFFGELFADGRFEKLAICVFEKDIKNPGASHWSSKDGFVIAAPAGSKEEALKIGRDFSLREDAGFPIMANRRGVIGNHIDYTE
jgi:hypothetical protein